MFQTQLVERPTGTPTGATPPTARLPNSGRRLLRFAAAPLVALLLLAPSVCWVAQDRSVWPWDQAWYGEVSVELYYTLAHNPRGWPAAMKAAFASKAPGQAWLGQWFVPLGQFLGSVDRGLHLSVLLWQFLTLVLIYRIGRELSPAQGGTAGVGGCALVGAAPLFVGMSHQYMTEALQTLAVTWFFYCALSSPRWGRIRILAHLAAATAVAMLAKTTSPLYCLLPGLMAVVQLLRRRPILNDRAGPLALAVRIGGLALGIGLLAGAAVWYRANWQAVRHHAYIASVSDIALQYGHKDVFSRKFAFWFAALREGLFTPPLFWMAAFLTLTAVAVWGSRLGQAAWLRRPSAANCLALLAALQVAILLVAFAFTINEDTRFLTAVAPAVAVLLMWAVANVPVRAAGVVFATAALAQWGFVHAITLGVSDWKGHCWLVPVERDATHAEETARVVRLTSELADRYNIVGIELPWCNANSLAYYAAKHKLAARRRANYTSLGYAETDVGKALGRIDAINPTFFISLEEGAQPKPPNCLNQVAAPVLAKLQRDERYARLPFLTQFGIVVFKRSP
ncbi:MAG TPA: glycosyltransferase family 39 protein [Gemmataceae bacterium]